MFAEQVSRQFLSAHRVTVVSSISAARAEFLSGGHGLVLSDYDLDDGKRDEFVRECRVIRPDLPVIAVSTHDAGNEALVQASASTVCSKMEFHRIGEVISRSFNAVRITATA